MKRLIFLFAGLCLLLFFNSQSFAYIERSLRMKALGEDLIGILRDEYTDIYRNPAYLNMAKEFKVFARYNKVGYPDIKLADPIGISVKGDDTFPTGFSLVNDNAVLAGLTLPSTKLGDLAFAMELRPSSSKNRNEIPVRYNVNIPQGIYTKSYELYEDFSKRSIRGFKPVYAKKFGAISLGLDYLYLKGYQFSGNSSVRRTELYDLDTDSLLFWGKSEQEYDNDLSSISHQGRVGLFFNPRKELSIDIVLGFEYLKYPDLNSRISESEDSTIVNQSANVSSLPHKLKAWVWLGDLKYSLSPQTEISFLLGIRYQKDKESGSSSNSSFSDNNISNYSVLDDKRTIYNYDDKIFNLLFGTGLETNLKPFLKLATGLKLRWENERLNHSNSYQEYRKEILQGVVYEYLFSFKEEGVKRTNNSYKVSLPVGLEIEIIKKLFARMGASAAYRDVNTEKQSFKRTNLAYSLGASYSIKDRLYIDLYTDRNVTDFQSWSFALGYIFKK